MKKKEFFRGFVIFYLVLGLSAGAYAKEAVDDLSLADLMNLEMTTATKRKISVRKAPAIATVITAAEIRSMGARNLTDVLKMVPGFGVSILSSGRSSFEVRGIRTATNEKILVMMDGHRLNEPYDGSAITNLFDTLSVENAKQIEIIRGPGSALYGANAFVAAVNIITKDAEDTDGVEVTAAAGSFDTKTISVVGGKSFEKFKIAGSVEYVDTDGTKPTIDADRFAGKPFSKTPGEANLYLEQTDAFLKASYGNLIFRGHFMDRDKGSYIGVAQALTDGNEYPQQNFWTDMEYSYSFTDRASAKFRIYYDHFKSDVSLKLLPEGVPGFPDGMIGKPHLKIGTTGTELQSDMDMFKGNHLIIGVNYEYTEQYDVGQVTNFNPWTNAPLGSLQDVSSWGNFNKDVTRKVWAVYIQDEWTITENLNLTAGVRHDHYDDFGGTTNPRLGVVWNFLKDADFKLLYGQAFRAPSFVELYNDGNPTVIGNPNLQPEEIKTYEAALEYRLKNSHGIGLTYFHNDIDNLITRDTATPAHYINKGGAKVEGIEVGLWGKYSADNYWKLSYTYQNPKDADTDARLPDVPSQRASLSVNYGFTKYLSGHTDILWTGGRPRIANDPRPDSSSYTTVDLTLIAKNFYKTLEIRGMIHNLFDERYTDPDTTGAAQLIPGDYPREGISAMIEVGYKF
jgi:iron complex outermembrane receptor protein